MAYMVVVEDSKDRLVLARRPSVLSQCLFVGAVACGFGAACYSSDVLLWKVLYVTGAIYVGLITLDNWEECEFDKTTNEIKLKRYNLLQRLFHPHLRHHTVVINLEEVVGVRVEEKEVRYFGTAHQVVLLLATSTAVGMTEEFTMGSISDHYTIADKIRTFLELENPSAPQDTDDYLGDGSSSDSFEQLDPDEISDMDENTDL